MKWFIQGQGEPASQKKVISQLLQTYKMYLILEEKYAYFNWQILFWVHFEQQKVIYLQKVLYSHRHTNSVWECLFSDKNAFLCFFVKKTFKMVSLSKCLVSRYFKISY